MSSVPSASVTEVIEIPVLPVGKPADLVAGDCCNFKAAVASATEILPLPF